MENTFQIYLSLKMATSKNSDNSICNFTLPQINIDSQKQIVLSVSHASIPYTFYQINGLNNILNYHVSNTDSSFDINKYYYFPRKL